MPRWSLKLLTSILIILVAGGLFSRRAKLINNLQMAAGCFLIIIVRAHEAGYLYLQMSTTCKNYRN